MNFIISRPDDELIDQIVKRAKNSAASRHIPFDIRTLMMDLTACHANGCALRLDDLLEASEFDFAHDVFGIHKHIDRNTGKLGDCFLPRYARS